MSTSARGRLPDDPEVIADLADILALASRGD
jgi:hypothetical protein